MRLLSSTRDLGKAPAILAVAVVLALSAEQLFERQFLVPSLAAAAVALLLSCYVAYLSAPHVARWGRLRGWRLPWSYRITREGLAFVLAILVVAAAAVISGNNLLYLVLSSMLAAVLLSGLISRLVLAGLQLQVSFPEHIFAGQPVLARVVIRNLKRWFPSFSIWMGVSPGKRDKEGMAIEEAYFPMIAGRRALAAAIQASFPRRGRYTQEAVWLRTRFPFSFVERRARVSLPQGIVVYPSVASGAGIDDLVRRLESQWQTRSRGDSHDLYRIRPAVAGDGARFVDWKASARAGGLWVREFTKDDHRRVHIVFDRLAPLDAEGRRLFEQAAQRCAAFAWRIQALNASIRFTSDDCSISSAASSSGIFEILRYLALCEPIAAPPNQEVAGGFPRGAGRDDYTQVVFSSTAEQPASTLHSSQGRYSLPERPWR